MKYLIWDFDGTLAYREGMWSGSLIEVLDREMPTHALTSDMLRPYLRSGFPWHTPETTHSHLSTADQWWEALTPVFVKAYRALGIDERQALALANQVRHQYYQPQQWQVYDDTRAQLDLLSRHGWTHVVLSNHGPELPQLIEALGLHPFITKVFTSALTGYEKPHPQAFECVLEELRPFDAAWMIGDNFAADVLGAMRVGLSAILVRNHHADAVHCCVSLQDVVAIVG